MEFVTSIGMSPNDCFALQRVVGFVNNTNRLKVDDIMMRIMERANKRAMIEQQTLMRLSNDIKSKGYTLEAAFSVFDSSGDGCISERELRNAFKAMKIEVAEQVFRNIINLFDIDKDDQISLVEFQKLMSKYFEQEPNMQKLQ